MIDTTPSVQTPKTALQTHSLQDGYSYFSLFNMKKQYFSFK